MRRFMSFIVALGMVLMFGANAWAQCGLFAEDSYDIDYLCVESAGVNYNISLDYYNNPADGAGHYWKLEGAPLPQNGLTPQDRIEIEQLLKDYAWGVDHKDSTRWMDIWSSNAVYDLSNLGFGTVEGPAALQGFMNCIVFPGEPMCFSLISNIDIQSTGVNTAEGTDYFIHEGYVPVDRVDSSIKYSQFDPTTWRLLEELLAIGAEPLLDTKFAFVRDHKEGQHKYEFVKENGKWKISYLKGLPLYSAKSELVEPVTVKPDEQDPSTWYNKIPIDQRPDQVFFNNWLPNGCQN